LKFYYGGGYLHGYKKSWKILMILWTLKHLL
jgi:hypothetical protein